ncbi:MAG: PilZ domain-containing protein [Bryobacteraceae bacterium]
MNDTLEFLELSETEGTKPESLTPEPAEGKRNQASKKERRRAPRIRAKRELVRAAWTSDDGTFRVELASLIDISAGGAALEMREAPRVGTVIRFQCERVSLLGMGSVRYANHVNGRSTVGVQFTPDTFWASAAQREFLSPPRTGH